MASGRQLSDENVAKFVAWIASKTDADFRSLAIRGVLSRSDITAECGFARSVLTQNPRIRTALRDLEDQLRERGVLPQAAQDAAGESTEAAPSSPLGAGSFRDADRLRRLEQENAALRAELAEVKQRLSRFAVLQDVLAETGRLPR